MESGTVRVAAGVTFIAVFVLHGLDRLVARLHPKS